MTERHGAITRGDLFKSVGDKILELTHRIKQSPDSKTIVFKGMTRRSFVGKGILLAGVVLISGFLTSGCQPETKPELKPKSKLFEDGSGYSLEKRGDNYYFTDEAKVVQIDFRTGGIEETGFDTKKGIPIFEFEYKKKWRWEPLEVAPVMTRQLKPNDIITICAVLAAGPTYDGKLLNTENDLGHKTVRWAGKDREFGLWYKFTDTKGNHIRPYASDPNFSEEYQIVYPSYTKAVFVKPLEK